MGKANPQAVGLGAQSQISLELSACTGLWLQAVVGRPPSYSGQHVWGVAALDIQVQSYEVMLAGKPLPPRVPGLQGGLLRPELCNGRLAPASGAASLHRGMVEFERRRDILGLGGGALVLPRPRTRL